MAGVEQNITVKQNVHAGIPKSATWNKNLTLTQPKTYGIVEKAFKRFQRRMARLRRVSTQNMRTRCRLWCTGKKNKVQLEALDRIRKSHNLRNAR